MIDQQQKPVANLKPLATPLANIQGLRGIAALLVFAAHLTGAEQDYGNSTIHILPDFLHLGVIGVDLFFLISGYVMVHVAHGRSRGIRPALRFAYNRATRIYPLYWLATFALLILYIGKAIFFGEVTLISNFWRSVFLLPDKTFPILPVGWTLIFELYFYLIFSAYILFRRLDLWALLGFWASLIVLANILGWPGINEWTGVIFSPLTLEFIAGAAIAGLINNGMTAYAKSMLIIGIIAILMLMIPIGPYLWPDAMIDHGLRTLLFLPPFAMILYGSVACEVSAHKTSWPILQRAGDASYALYLIHVPIILLVGKAISTLHWQGPLGNSVLVFACLLSGLLGSWVFHLIAERPLLKLSKNWGKNLFRPD